MGRWIRRRPLLLAWALLLALSHGWRAFHPFDGHPPAPDHQVLTVHEVRGALERSRPVRLAYRDLGRDPAGRPVVLLIHGSPGDGRAFRDVAPALASRFRVLVPDLPGFGASTWRVPDYSIRAHAGYLRQLLDSLGIARVHLVGFSMGAGVALHLADQVPDRIRSLTLLSAIGAQEYELLGDYRLNHLIHGLQLGALWLLREAVPHFGMLDGGFFTVEYARNFYDSDQRPLRRLMERLAMPVLILHGEHDPLVAPAAAREHARIIPQSELRMDLGDHFAVFQRPELVAAPLAEFLGRVEQGGARTRAAAEPHRLAAAAAPFDPRRLPPVRGFTLILVCFLLAAATLLSEDLTCIAAGLMVARGTLGFLPAAGACFVGIYLGDLLLFGAGRWLGRRWVGRAPFRWVLSAADIERSAQWLSRKGMALVFLSRFLPGTRLPTYFTAGLLRASGTAFASYFFLACLLWTPVLIGLARVYGEATLAILRTFQEHLSLFLLVAGLGLFFLIKLVLPLCSWRGRRLLLSAWRRRTRWEYWPRWVFYPPVVLYVLWLGLKHRSLTLFTAANPAIPGGGLVGESKAAILRGLDGGDGLVARFDLIPAFIPPEERPRQALAFKERHQLPWPLVLKPDIGERGSGVAIVRNEVSLRAYLGAASTDTIVQEYVPGAEFGVFYYRLPDEETGRIFSITEKRFPAVVGDGRRTLEELILADDRAVAMAPYYLRLHAPRLAWVPAAGERVQLVELGTHCRGAAFYDGGWVRTPLLEAAIDRLSRRYDGFWIGRYDIRTPNLDDFRAGRNFKVVELNGVAAEATHIYDPKTPLGTAYRTLFAQWRLLFDLAARNVRRGARPASLGDLFRLLAARQRATRSHRDR